ncbi:hypothetical protein VE26_12460 [Devosia chinhatensis]|uniref:diguanylate cyclase n=1 Tax=Devosia chinhatensis TaxID=429727 RepID=A0A0F5FH87_9HYPH|nr:hypothetical protein VE26_12460 [Devosia chinhatensis]
MLALSQEWVQSWSRSARIIGMGVLMGLGAGASMELSIEVVQGVRFDLRLVMVSLSGIFGGPVAGLISGVIAALFRIQLGGAGVPVGIAVTAIAVGLGWAGFVLRRRFGLRPSLIAALSLTEAMMPALVVLMLPQEARNVAAGTVMLPFMALTGVAFSLAVIGIEHSRYRGWLTHLTKVALSQAPDFFYIKDRQGRIVLANDAAARVSGLAAGGDAVGLTDFDLTDADRAQVLFDAEQALFRTGVPIVDFEEDVPQADGSVRTMVTTKRPIFNADGSIAGLVGVTKDLTERLALERKVSDTRAELDVVLNEMSEGLARFDDAFRLVFSNANYRALFPLTGEARQPGAHIRDILKAVVETGEQVLDGLAAEDWIAAVIEKMDTGGEEQVKMYDGRWLLIRSTPLRAGGTVVIVSDISDLKEAERNLMAVAEQMRVLSITDALTGLHNRRDFDNGLAAHFETARREGFDLSVILFDIDRFKAYNDTYGHPAGDSCLKRVAASIRDNVKRPADLVARMGGEEFAVLLPNTSLSGAQKVADNIRGAIEGLSMPHSGAENGRVTISAGVAALDREGRIETGDQLVEKADRALYAAKANGRNQVVSAPLG